ncbi:MAG: MTH1187 family thiamine-binding protein [Thermoplasmatota archaeon]
MFARALGFHWKPASMWIGQICTEDEEMLAEFSVVPIGKGESVSQYVAECLKIVEASGIAYKLNPMGTVLEGDYDAVMAVIRACHVRVMGICPRVMTTVRIDDRKGVQNALEKKIASVEKKVGKELKK